MGDKGKKTFEYTLITSSVSVDKTESTVSIIYVNNDIEVGIGTRISKFVDDTWGHIATI